jgi:RNA polymerase sigma factor FliA
LRSLDWVPRTVRQRSREVERAYETLEGELGREPSDDELAERLQMSTRELDVVRQRMRGTSVISLEEPNVGETLEDTESDVTTEIERDEMRAELVAAVESLPLPERTVIQRYYFSGETLREIKGALGVSESRVSQIHAKAVERLRQRLRDV